MISQNQFLVCSNDSTGVGASLYSSISKFVIKDVLHYLVSFENAVMQRQVEERVNEVKRFIEESQFSLRVNLGRIGVRPSLWTV